MKVLCIAGRSGMGKATQLRQLAPRQDTGAIAKLMPATAM
jgi:putative ribosome biogenesis GTPase RsgA